MKYVREVLYGTFLFGWAGRPTRGVGPRGFSEEEVDEEDDVLEDFGGDIGGSRNRDLAIC